MSKGNLEEKIRQLRQLRNTALDAAAAALLRKSLRDRSNLIVGEAAQTAGALPELIPDLLAAYDRLFADPVKTDPKCWGKTAIVKALAQLDYEESGPFLRGSRHVQMEPVWGEKEDSAVALRANSVLALVQCRDLRRGEILRHLVDAMHDPVGSVRIEAVRALERMNGEEAALILRSKARTGDESPAVIGQVFDALLSLEGTAGAEFAARYLAPATPPEIRDEAALALGASRLPEAVAILIATWEQKPGGEFGKVLLRALSSSRQQAALDLLLDLVRTGDRAEAAAAFGALELHQDSPDIWEPVETAMRQRRAERPTSD